jgi:hypothetical protein
MKIQKGDRVMNKEKQILNYMEKLGLSREEAEQLYKDEEEDNLPELTAGQKKVEKEMRQADRKKETAPRKREREPNGAKLLLLSILYHGIDDYFEDTPHHEKLNFTVINPEREFEFIFENVKYRITLSKPRKEKKNEGC